MTDEPDLTDLRLNRKALGERLRVAMKGRLTQEELAEATGASLSGVKKWLSGVSDPGWSSVVAAAQACGVSLDWLATGRGPMRLEDAPVADAAATVLPPPPDPQLIGRLTERVLTVYKEMGVAIAVHQAAERAVREANRIAATTADPEERLILVGETIAAIRQELRAGGVDDAGKRLG